MYLTGIPRSWQILSHCQVPKLDRLRVPRSREGEGDLPARRKTFWRKEARVAKPGMRKWLTGKWYRAAISCTGLVRLFPGLGPGGKLHPDKGCPERSTGLGKPSWFGNKRNAVGQDEHPEGPTQLVKQPERGAAAGGGRRVKEPYLL